MPARLFERFKDLQAYVGWTEVDAARVKSAAHVIDAGMDALIDDFYAEIQRHPDAARVITGGQAQITPLDGELEGVAPGIAQGSQRPGLFFAPLEYRPAAC